VSRGFNRLTLIAARQDDLHDGSSSSRSNKIGRVECKVYGV
jgi:hypothetical protein